VPLDDYLTRETKDLAIIWQLGPARGRVLDEFWDGPSPSTIASAWTALVQV
jgi:hypothetical protein